MIDIEALKQEVNTFLNERYIKTDDEYENEIVSSTIDYIADKYSLYRTK